MKVEGSPNTCLLEILVNSDQGDRIFILFSLYLATVLGFLNRTRFQLSTAVIFDLDINFDDS